MRKHLFVAALCGALASINTACFESPTDAEYVGSKPATVERSSADGQSAVVGTTVGGAPTVLVKDERGLPLSGVSVTFQVVRGGGSLGQSSSVSDQQGLASAESWT